METVRSKSMIAVRQGVYVVYVHTAESPSDEEWDLAMRFYEAADVSRLKTLVYTDGAAPNAAQRGRLNAALGGHKLLMALLTPSVFARAAGTAISWFNPNVRVFGPGDFDAALRHLAASPEEGATLSGLVEKHKAELGISFSAAERPAPP
ncbi:MAG TPA: hypothetical protein VM686_41130 [Polyangiaceae bacterium]|nr:hypothetical protein [Polyangiaceae bacterium]